VERAVESGFPGGAFRLFCRRLLLWPSNSATRSFSASLAGALLVEASPREFARGRSRVLDQLSDAKRDHAVLPGTLPGKPKAVPRGSYLRRLAEALSPSTAVIPFNSECFRRRRVDATAFANPNRTLPAISSVHWCKCWPCRRLVPGGYFRAYLTDQDISGRSTTASPPNLLSRRDAVRCCRVLAAYCPDPFCGHRSSYCWLEAGTAASRSIGFDCGKGSTIAI